MAFLVDLVRATPMPLLCLFTLIISMVLVCDGFRVTDKSIGGRTALTGALGAIASMYYRYQLSTGLAGICRRLFCQCVTTGCREDRSKLQGKPAPDYRRVLAVFVVYLYMEVVQPERSIRPPSGRAEALSRSVGV